MKHILTSGMKIGQLTLIREVPYEIGRGYDWICRCNCGLEERKRRSCLTNPKLVHRCRECFKKSQRALWELQNIFKGDKS